MNTNATQQTLLQTQAQSQAQAKAKTQIPALALAPVPAPSTFSTQDQQAIKTVPLPVPVPVSVSIPVPVPVSSRKVNLNAKSLSAMKSTPRTITTTTSAKRPTNPNVTTPITKSGFASFREKRTSLQSNQKDTLALGLGAGHGAMLTTSVPKKTIKTTARTTTLNKSLATRKRPFELVKPLAMKTLEEDDKEKEASTYQQPSPSSEERPLKIQKVMAPKAPLLVKKNPSQAIAIATGAGVVVVFNNAMSLEQSVSLLPFDARTIIFNRVMRHLESKFRHSWELKRRPFGKERLSNQTNLFMLRLDYFSLIVRFEAMVDYWYEHGESNNSQWIISYQEKRNGSTLENIGYTFKKTCNEMK